MEVEMVVECVNLEKKYFLFDKDYKVIPWLFTKKGCIEERIPLSNINLTINKGDVIGFIGKNGAGKSTLMKIIAGITSHTDGGIIVKGKVNSLINLGAGFNPKLTGRQNIYYKGLLMGMTEAKIDEIIDDITDFCELGTYFDLPLYMYSSGMSARLGFALAIFAEHDILIVDEVFAVGDKMFREKSAKKMEELFRSGKSIIFASHSDEQIRQFCNRAIFIDESKIVVDGTVDEALNAYNRKYDPNKVVKLESEKDKFDNVDSFIGFTNKLKFEKADIYRELSIFHKEEGNVNLAYKYMLYARHFRPEGHFIVNKISELENLLTSEECCKYIIIEEEFSYTDRFMTIVSEYRNLEKADIYREIALFHEFEGKIDLAHKYMHYAKELRPLGPYINEKCNEYDEKIKS